MTKRKMIRPLMLSLLSIIILNAFPQRLLAKSEIRSTSRQTPLIYSTTENSINQNAVGGTSQSFAEGMVTLTFDDGWLSQYKNALPILTNAQMPASFYIITNAMLLSNSNNDGNILCNDPLNKMCDGAQITVRSNSWTAANQYPDPGENTYIFKQTYTSSGTVTLTISYFNASGRAISGKQNLILGSFPASSADKNISVTFVIPNSVFKISGSFFTMKETVPNGKILNVKSSSLYRGHDLDTYMNSSQVSDLQTKGMEVSAHTMDHCDLVMLETNPASATTGGTNGPPLGACASEQSVPKTAKEEISGSRGALLSLGLTPVDTFVYPYGSFDGLTETLLKSFGFIASRSTIPGFNTKDTDSYGLYMQNVDEAVTNNGLSIVTGWINTAIANKSWLILMFHNVEPMTVIKANGDVDGTTPEFLQSIVDYLKTKNVCILTMHNAMKAMGTSIANPCVK